MWLLVLLYTLVLAGLIIFGLISYARWNLGSLEKVGIPVVKPKHFLLGSAMLPYEMPGGLMDIELMKKYGPIFGFYNGREPQIVVCDAEVIRLVTTKDSDYFDAKRQLDFGDPLFNEFLDLQPLEKWKLLRGISMPVLSSSIRIKGAIPAMTEAINDFISGVKKQVKEDGKDGRLHKFGINEAIYGMLTDLLARSQFSIDIGKSDVNNKFVKLVKALMSSPAAETPWISTYVFAFPFLTKFLPDVLINPEPCREFGVIIKQLIGIRTKQIEAEAKGESPTRTKDWLDNIVEWYGNLDTPEYKKAGITENSIFNLALTMFIAGQDQMSLILGAMFYFISKMPQVEKRLHAEVDKVFASCPGGKLEHDSLSDLTYLTACITEAVRLYPFFFRGERVCTKDWEDKERGLKIKKGTVVIIGIWAANRNPEYFDEPEEFNPERFMPGEREKMHSYAFTSWGFGPRGCPGKRLAMEIMTLLAANMLKEFRFVKREDSKIQFVPAGLFTANHEPMYFDVEVRGK